MTTTKTVMAEVTITARELRDIIIQHFGLDATTEVHLTAEMIGDYYDRDPRPTCTGATFKAPVALQLPPARN